MNFSFRLPRRSCNKYFLQLCLPNRPLIAFAAVCLLALALLIGMPNGAAAQNATAVQDDLLQELGEDYGADETRRISDPLEPMNRVFFQVNDKLYLYLLKPVSSAYARVLPENFRDGLGNAFYNLRMPGRLVNNLLQGRPVRAAKEAGRFAINTLFGFGGLLEPAKGIGALASKPPEKDTGLTLATWGTPPGLYLIWPVLGPSSLRASLGKVGDHFLDPLSYVDPSLLGTGLKAGERINSLSFRLGEYEDLKESALDPYSALKDAYTQYRFNQIDK